MKKTILLTTVIFFVVILSGCGKKEDAEQIIKDNNEPKEKLESQQHEVDEFIEEPILKKSETKSVDQKIVSQEENNLYCEKYKNKYSEKEYKKRKGVSNIEKKQCEKDNEKRLEDAKKKEENNGSKCEYKGNDIECEKCIWREGDGTNCASSSINVSQSNCEDVYNKSVDEFKNYEEDYDKYHSECKK